MFRSCVTERALNFEGWNLIILLIDKSYNLSILSLRIKWSSEKLIILLILVSFAYNVIFVPVLYMHAFISFIKIINLNSSQRFPLLVEYKIT